MRHDVVWIEDGVLSVGGSGFHCSFNRPQGPPGSIPIMKTPPMVDAYADLVRELDPRHIVELGIRAGGSTALLHALADPEMLVAVELVASPAAALADYVERVDAADVVRAHYGVDQADRARLVELVDDAANGSPLDLVVDDASHLYEPSLASFEVLFPRLRPGGRYVIEDWTSYYLKKNRWADHFARPLSDAERSAIEDHLRKEGMPQPEPLISLLTLELVLARASDRDVVADIHVDRYWTVVTRGTEPLDPTSFRLRDHYHDHMNLFERILPPR